MVNPIQQIAKLITEHPDIINHNILIESLENKIKKLLTKISNRLPHEINIDEITQFATQQRFKEAGVSRWIARQVAFNPNLRVDWQSLTDYITHLKFRDNDKYKTILKNNIQEVIKDAEEWHSQFQANDNVMMANDEPIIAEFPNGYKIVKLTTREHCKAEGKAMGHCVGGYDPKETDLYSLRSPDGKPHVTIQVFKDGMINQIKGRQNKPPIKKYADLIIPWVNSILNEPKKLFDDPDVNFDYGGFSDYLGSLYNEGLLFKLAKSDNVNIKLRVANSPVLPNVLRYLSKDDDLNIRAKVARNSNTPPDTLRTLSKDNDLNIRAKVAMNSNTPLDTLRTLSKYNDWYIRARVAENSNTPPDVLRFLSYDKDKNVRTNIAWNSNTPPDVLRFLSYDENKNVKINVANNPSTHSDVLRFLSQDKDNWVRTSVANNPNTPPNTLRSLSQDKYKRVRSKVAENSSTPPDVLRILSEEDDNWIRSEVAMNSNTPPDVLRYLSKDKNHNVRSKVAKNLHTPPDILRLLSKDEDKYVRKAAIDNIKNHNSNLNYD